MNPISLLSRLVVLFLLAFVAAASVEAAYIRRVIGPGDPVPGVPGAIFENAGYPNFDYRGNIRFHGSLEGPNNTWRNNYGFWVESNGHLELNVRGGDPLPGGANEETIHGWFTSGNENDWVKVDLSGPNVDATNNSALIVMEPGSPRTIARAGQVAPGMALGTTFHSVGYQIGNSRSKNVFFDAHLVGPELT